MKHQEQLLSRIDGLSQLIKAVRRNVRLGKHVDASDIDDMMSFIASIRHNAEMYNCDRITDYSINK